AAAMDFSVIAAGRDASDVAITTSFGAAHLTKFTVVTDKIERNNLTSRSSQSGADASLIVTRQGGCANDGPRNGFLGDLPGVWGRKVVQIGGQRKGELLQCDTKTLDIVGSAY